MVTLKTFAKKDRIADESDFSRGSVTADITAWFRDGADEFLTRSDRAVLDVLEKIKKCSRPFQECADIQRGVTPFQLTERLIHRNSRSAFDGTVRRYTVDFGPDRFIRFDESLAEFKPARYFEGPRILLRELISRQMRLQGVLVSRDFVTNKSMQSALPIAGGPDLRYLLGLLNSSLLSWYFLQRSNVAHRDDFPKIVLKETRELPIRVIDFGEPTQKTMHDALVSLVDQILAAKRAQGGAGIPACRSEADKNVCATLEAEIDRHVYALYGLTPEEIKIVEGSNPPTP